MKRIFGLIFIGLFLFCSSAKADITIGIGLHTINNHNHHLKIFYIASDDHVGYPGNVWGYQTFTLRWPDTLGKDAIISITNNSNFRFRLEKMESKNGWVYQKFKTQSGLTIQDIHRGNQLDVLHFEKRDTTVDADLFELVTSPNIWVVNNNGQASANQPVGGQQFTGFNPAQIPHTPLPVELAEFQLENIENRMVHVSWKTLSERNNQYFEIQRSAFVDEEPEMITQIAGNGNSNQLLYYRYLDENPLEGLSYYRLAQVDFDGKTTYSEWKKIIVSENKKDEPLTLSVSPNPSHNNNINLQINGLQADFQIRLMDSRGVILENIPYSWDFNSGFEQIDFDVSKYQTGAYMISVISQSEVVHQKVLLNK